MPTDQERNIALQEMIDHVERRLRKKTSDYSVLSTCGHDYIDELRRLETEIAESEETINSLKGRMKCDASHSDTL